MVIDIPALYSVFKGGELRTAPVKFEGSRIIFRSEPVKSAYSTDGSEERMPVLVVDMKGLEKKELDDRLLTNMKLPGSDIWFMTRIEDIEDVFDCFMSDIVKILVPYHTTRNDLVMEEVFDVSENCIPALFITHGKVICRGDQTKDIAAAMEELKRIGFSEIAIIDTDSTLRHEDWALFKERSEGIIPYSGNGEKIPGEIEFRYTIYDLF